MAAKSKNSKLIEPKQAKRILIINLGGIGDILLSIPALKALRRLYYHAEINLVTVPRVFELKESLSFIDKVFTLSFERKLSMMLQNLNKLLAFRKGEFDIAINMRTIVSNWSALKLKILLNVINPKLKVGRDTDGRGYFFDVKIPEALVGNKYEMEYDIDTVKALGAETIDRNIDFKVDNKNVEHIDEILRNRGIFKDDLVIGIHPGGKPPHRWPLDNFSKVINKIAEKINCKFVITGSRDEIDLANRLKSITKAEVIVLAGETGLNELFALIKRCDLFISNDTGLVHIAAVLKTPLVAIFGAGDVIRFDPHNISNRTAVLYKKTDCSPCNRISCNSMKCLARILPEEVIEASLKLLKG
jgi:heptosyltransferase-2